VLVQEAVIAVAEAPEAAIVAEAEAPSEAEEIGDVEAAGEPKPIV
jgi:hypothetical protein